MSDIYFLVGSFTLIARDISAAWPPHTLVRRALRTTDDSDRARIVRRPQAGEEFVTPGPAMGSPGLEQGSGEK